MSGAGTAAKPLHRFCWECSKQLHGNFHRVVRVNGVEHVVHAGCVGDYEVVEGKHLAKTERTRG